MRGVKTLKKWFIPIFAVRIVQNLNQSNRLSNISYTAFNISSKRSIKKLNAKTRVNKTVTFKMTSIAPPKYRDKVLV